MAGLIGGKYKLGEHVGRGGMGDVWRAEDRRALRPVALKLLQTRYLGEEQMRRRFEREWLAIKGLTHENVVRAYDHGQGDVDGSPVMYIAMELLDGQSLQDLIDLEDGGGLLVPDALHWAQQMCGALEAAHGEKLVHRDLKPANIQITTTRGAVLLDFGIACFQEDEEGHTRITPTGGQVGTPPYMSPEQFECAPVTNRSDLYSLGCVLYAMLTGSQPFKGSVWQIRDQHLSRTPPSPRKVRGDSAVPRELNDLVMHLMEKEPEKRPVDAAEVRERLDGIRQARAHRSHGVRTTAPSTRNSDGRTAVLTPEPRPVQVPVRATGAEEWSELAGACLVAGVGTFGLLYGTGGVDADASLLGGVIGVGVPLFGGLAANHGVGLDSVRDTTAKGLVLTVLAVLLAGCVWLLAATGDFAWYNDLFLGLALTLGVIGATAAGAIVGGEAGRSDGATVMAALNGTCLGGLGAVLFAAHQHFAWWTTVLGASCVWGAGLALTGLAYKFART